MKWECEKCKTMLHDDENSFGVYGRWKWLELKYGKKKLKPPLPEDGVIWKCPVCHHIMIEEWKYHDEVFDFQKFIKIVKKIYPNSNME